MKGTRTPKDALTLFKKTAATSFEEAYPIGNGHLGAMVYGGIRAMGGRSVSLRVKDGVLTECEILGTPPAAIYLNGRNVTADFTCQNGKMRYGI